VDQVVRGDDLLPSSPRQAYLGDVLGYPQPGEHIGKTRLHADPDQRQPIRRAPQSSTANCASPSFTPVSRYGPSG
jgi:hypothetical protein